MQYQTRRLEAVADIPLEIGRYVVKGERFSVSDVDAQYLIERGKAVEVESVAVDAASDATNDGDAQPTRGRRRQEKA